VADERPPTDDRDPADVVSGMVDHVLRLVDTWPAEAHSRLERLAQVWRLRLRSLDGERLDRREGDAWTIREIAFHIEASAYYADAVGDLRPA
jgi:hypothetical protein